MRIMTGREYVGFIDPWTDEERLTDEEIVRCRDCKYMHIWDVSAIYQNHDHDSCHCLRFVDGYRMTVTEDGFCAWGERRDA